MADAVPDELRARIDAAAGAGADPGALAAAACDGVGDVLDLIAAGRGVREAGSGLNAASSALLVADALLTDAAARAALEGTLDDVVGALDLDQLDARARVIDEGAA